MSLTITAYLQINSDKICQGTYTMVAHGISFFVPQNLYIITFSMFFCPLQVLSLTKALFFNGGLAVRATLQS